jgi:hypothetical protein
MIEQCFVQLKNASVLSKPAKPLRLESKHKSNNNKQQDISHSKLVHSACVLVCPSFPWSPHVPSTVQCVVIQ